ncbi:MAG: hypothetical protein LIP16_12595 [Clostridium sp.]|nr:hypothetical protein [Clostridium sp.]
MIEFDLYKEKKLQKLKQRLAEINELVGLESTLNCLDRHDEFAVKLKEKNAVRMKQHFNEMMGIKIKIARLEGNESIFERENFNE